MLHNPAELPDVEKESYYVGHERNALFNVHANMIETMDDLIRYSPEKRQCYFDGERKLKFFNIYTENNCQMECVANHTLQECGCVRFEMIRSNDTKVCSLSDIECYQKAMSETFVDMNENIDPHHGDRYHDNCTCLPSCTYISYSVETSQLPINFGQFLKDLYPEDYSMTKMYAKIEIVFKDSHFFNLQRDEDYDWKSFLSSCGGLLGLFLGVSLVSIIEIIYHLTLRLLCTWEMKRQTEAVRTIKVKPARQQRIHIDLNIA